MAVLIINPNSTVSMTEAMLSAARLYAPDLAFDAWTSHDGPPAIQGRRDGEVATPPLLRLADAAEAAGIDGLVVGCFDDTALAEVRARVSCPVVGIGEAAYTYCALRGWRFSVVTTLPVSVQILEENIVRYGFASLLGRVRASDVPVLALEASPAETAERILLEARTAASEDDIDAVILGCAGMVQVTERLRRELECAVIDPVEAAAGCMLWLTNAGATGGRPA